MSNNDWWTKKLSGNQAPRPTTPPTTPPSAVPYTIQRQQPNMPVAYDAENDQVTTKAVSSRVSDVCPNCMSGNYFAPQGTQRMRCYDCGYPVVQSGSGAGMPSGSGGGDVQKAKQVGSSGFNPNIIVDRIG
jgi:hypothetical protein